MGYKFLYWNEREQTILESTEPILHKPCVARGSTEPYGRFEGNRSWKVWSTCKKEDLPPAFQLQLLLLGVS